MNNLNFYIGGEWVKPHSTETIEVRSPYSGKLVSEVALGDDADAIRAIEAARVAFETFSTSTRAERLDLLVSVASVYEARKRDIADIMIEECGFPYELAHSAQVGSGSAHLQAMIETLKTYPFEELRGSTLVRREPIGVCALITPWNWPMNQIVCKVAPALASGCTMVLKPSELAPLNALIFAEIMHDAGVPPGVFNLVNGTGDVVGTRISTHPDVDMVSFTGSTRAGVAVATAAAPTVKRVHQELGGKSPFIILPGADLRAAVTDAVDGCFRNAGQSCNAPTRLLVERSQLAEVNEFAVAAAARYVIGDPKSSSTNLGPVISKSQKRKIEHLIETALAEGATLLTGGLRSGTENEAGNFVNPTVLTDVTRDMTIFREEVFGPVLSITAYDDTSEALALANDTPYGLAAYVHGSINEELIEISRKLRVGTVHINTPDWDPNAPFGGYKMSGNGREYAEYGLTDFLEIKGVLGYKASLESSC